MRRNNIFFQVLTILSEGCDGIEPDNIDCYQNEDCWGSMINPTVGSGDEILQQQLDWNIWQANYAHR